MSDPTAALASRLASLGLRPPQPFAKPELVVEALTHSSYATETGTRHYERLEMLGDAILGFTVAELLFTQHSEAEEGALTRKRAQLVQTRALAMRARELGLDAVVRLGRGEAASGGRQRDALLADIFEAVIAALYLSEGLELVRVLVERLFREEAVRLDTSLPAFSDFKTALQERTQAAWKAQPTYRVAETRGADHDRTFVVEALLYDEVVGRGEGRTKKQAEQQAAHAALVAWERIAARRNEGVTPVAGPAREP